MKYMGSKARFAKDIVQIMQDSIHKASAYIEPFAGGMNMVSAVKPDRGMKRIANDSNKYLIAMFKALQAGWEPPDYVEKEDYLNIKHSNCDDHIKGWAGFNCSYSGKYFGGFAGKTQTRQGLRNYQEEAKKNVLTQMATLKDVVFLNEDYTSLAIPTESVVYCDPPYADTTGYKDSFDSSRLWDWVREISKNNTVYVSEYNAPADFECIWEKQTKSSLSANGKSGGSKASTEKLFILKG